jgi:Skp family chaperone for outer membrane proteins
MRRRWVLVLSVVAGPLMAFAGGCNKGDGPSHAGNTQAEPAGPAASRPSGVAVIDLDEVAKQLGKDVVLLREISDGQTSLNQQLRNLQSSLQEKLRQKAQELETRSVGDASKPEPRKQQLAALERDLNLQLNEARRTAQNELNAHRQKLIQQFRDEVVPVAQGIAGERGLGVVITKNDTVLLACDDAHNITNAVVTKLRAQRGPVLGSATAASANRSGPPAALRR